MPSRPILILLALLPVTAPGQVQSVLHPKGEDAALIAEISWILFIGGGLIFFVVILLAGIALFAPQPRREWLSHRSLIIGGGIAFPVAVLSALLVYTFSSDTVAGKREPAAIRIEVTGELWWWRVRYLDAAGKVLLESANEIHLPVGKSAEVLLKSTEVIHSFWVPNLAGKLDLIPGRINRLRLQADAPGSFRGQCAEYCGAQHAKMALYVIAEEPPAFEAWLAAQMRPAATPRDDLQHLGQRLFLDNRCGQCHTVRGTAAAGKLGPDLTHVGSRASLAAGTLPNNPGTIAGWLTGSQQIKPGSRMPSFNQFSGHELRGLAAYLASLQ